MAINDIFSNLLLGVTLPFAVLASVKRFQTREFDLAYMMVGITFMGIVQLILGVTDQPPAVRSAILRIPVQVLWFAVPTLIIYTRARTQAKQRAIVEVVIAEAVATTQAAANATAAVTKDLSEMV